MSDRELLEQKYSNLAKVLAREKAPREILEYAETKRVVSAVMKNGDTEQALSDLAKLPMKERWDILDYLEAKRYESHIMSGEEFYIDDIDSVRKKVRSNRRKHALLMVAIIVIFFVRLWMKLS